MIILRSVDPTKNRYRQYAIEVQPTLFGGHGVTARWKRIGARRGEAYGLEMVKASEGRLKRGTIYVTLNRMEEKGYVESRKEPVKEGQQGPPRRLYKATGYGARVLDAWRMYLNWAQGGLAPGGVG